MPAAESLVQTCPKCGVALRDGHCPNCDGNLVLSRRAAAQALKPFVLVNVLALVGVRVVTYSVYPLLDRTTFLLIGIAILFVPYLFHLQHWFGKPFSASDLLGAKKLQVWAGIAAWALLVLIVCNGALDRSVSPTQAAVIARQATQGRYGSKSYSIVVESWRPSRDTERFSVDAGTYEGAVPNSTVSVDVHNGFFGWQWYSSVQMRSFRGTAP